jgi:hypothetical protein
MPSTFDDVKRDANGIYQYNPFNDDLFREIVDNVKVSPEGRQFFAEFYDSACGEQQTWLWIVAAISAVYRIPRAQVDPDKQYFVTVDQMRHALRLLMQNGEFAAIVRASEPELEVDTRPRSAKDGRFISAQEAAVEEYEEWTASNSSDACRERARTDRAYGDFYRAQNQRELRSEKVETAHTAAELLVTKESDRTNVALRQFADDYRKMPMSEIKRLSRMDSNPVGAAEFNAKFNRCVAAGLI